MKFNKILITFFWCAVIFTSGPGMASEKVMVDKDEYEQLKAAVKFLMEEREANMQAVEEAKQAAEDAEVEKIMQLLNADKAASGNNPSDV